MSGAFVAWGVFIILYLSWFATPPERGGLSERGARGCRKRERGALTRPAAAPLAESDVALLNRDAEGEGGVSVERRPLSTALLLAEQRRAPRVYDQEADA